MKTKATRQKLVFLSILLLILFTYPLITVANKISLAAGFPVLYLYIFITWGIAIILLLRIADGKQRRPDE
jgi:hypothetical protein